MRAYKEVGRDLRVDKAQTCFGAEECMQTKGRDMTGWLRMWQALSSVDKKTQRLKERVISWPPITE